MNPKTNCAGQDCPERDGCRRYVTRTADRVEGPNKIPVFEWASFDIERQQQGNCAAFISHRHREAANA